MCETYAPSPDTGRRPLLPTRPPKSPPSPPPLPPRPPHRAKSASSRCAVRTTALSTRDGRAGADVVGGRAAAVAASKPAAIATAAGSFINACDGTHGHCSGVSNSASSGGGSSNGVSCCDAENGGLIDAAQRMHKAVRNALAPQAQPLLNSRVEAHRRRARHVPGARHGRAGRGEQTTRQHRSPQEGVGRGERCVDAPRARAGEARLSAALQRRWVLERSITGQLTF